MILVSSLVSGMWDCGSTQALGAAWATVIA